MANLFDGLKRVKANHDLEVWRVTGQLVTAPATAPAVIDIIRIDPNNNEDSLWADTPTNRPTFAVGQTEVVVEQENIDIIKLPKGWKLRGAIVTADGTAAGLTLQVATRQGA